MRFSKLFFIVASVAMALVLSTSIMLAGRQHGHAIVLGVKDASTGADTAFFGYGGTDKTATYCIDADTLNLLALQTSAMETALPPLPPDGVFDVRFIDTRTGGGVCLDQGISNNFHQGSITAKADTFRIQMQGSVASGGAYPIDLAWSLPQDCDFTSAILKYTDPDDGPMTVNMLTSSTVSITKSDINKITFIINGNVHSPDAVREISNVVPEAFALNQNYPNPFNPTTTLSFAVKQTSDVTIAVYDILGQRIATLTSGQYAPGTFNATWNGTNDNGMSAASGTYYIRMNAKYTESNGEGNEFVSVQKVMLMK